MVSADEDPDDPYVRDRKYTKERREHLKSLLGTGSIEVDFSSKKGSGSGSPNNSLTRSTIVTLGSGGSGDDDTASVSSASANKTRHVANPKCACVKCGTALPYKPARGRAYISDQPVNDTPDEPLLAEKTSADLSTRQPSNTKSTKSSDTDVPAKSSPPKKDYRHKSAMRGASYSPVKECQQ